MNNCNHCVSFMVINKTLKKKYVEVDFKKASDLYEHKKKQNTKGLWQLIAKII